MLKSFQLNYHYGITPPKENGFAIKDVFINAEPGYITCLLGKNAAGKTTLLSLLYGMLRPKSGKVSWDGKEVKYKNLAAYHREVAYFGEKWCAEGLTVEKNVEMLSILYPTFDRELFDSLIKTAQAEGTLEKRYFELSTGERVKAELAFLIARKPKLIILDEPLANIDPVFKMDILELLQKGVAENGTGVLISTHLIDEISDMVDYIYVLDNGKIVKHGSRFELMGDGEGTLREVLN